MSTIRQTVQQEMQDRGFSQYTRQADPIITALERREAECLGRLREYAVNELSNVDEQQAARAMEQAGFDMAAYQRWAQEQQQRSQRASFSTPADSQQSGDVAQMISDLQNQVRELQRVARDAGVLH